MFVDDMRVQLFLWSGACRRDQKPSLGSGQTRDCEVEVVNPCFRYRHFLLSERQMKASSCARAVCSRDTSVKIRSSANQLRVPLLVSIGPILFGFRPLCEHAMFKQCFQPDSAAKFGQIAVR